MTKPVAVLYVVEGDSDRAAALDRDGIDVDTATPDAVERAGSYDCIVYEPATIDGDDRNLDGALRAAYPDVPVIRVASTGAGEPATDATRADRSTAADRLAERVRAVAGGRAGGPPQASDERDGDRLAALFENVGDPVVRTEFVDGEPVVRNVNEAFERVFGYEADRLLGEPLNDFIVPPDERESAKRLDDRAVSNERIQGEVRRQTADGIRYFLFRAVPIAPDDPTGNYEGFAIYTDITERKTRERRLEVLNRVLRHNMRNNVNVINGYAELLGADAEPQLVERAARTIRRTADDVASLTAKIRDIERAVDGGGRRPVELRPLVDRAVEPYRSAADVTTAVPDGLVVAAGDGLELAVENLVDNAVAHNDTDVPSVRVDARRDGSWIHIAVSDDGPGIPAAERVVLTGEHEITQLEHGSGLGLWLVNWAVTSSGGEVTFADNDPRGSVVTVRLPAASPPPDAASD
ncbi:PAS domain-containing sensor histidine kinase [Halostella litorea]|uniref:PAS domain-containing sensor histidine kinase n=1 Tax=Halostella litorea TaxID=2528831 RepID=UPI00109220BF|nr:PAS domain-containing sensor histidine kinase [Halostella litorea]